MNLAEKIILSIFILTAFLGFIGYQLEGFIPHWMTYLVAAFMVIAILCVPVGLIITIWS